MLNSCQPVRSEIVTYPSEQIPRVWPHVMPLIMKGITDRNAYAMPDIYKGLVDRDLQLWTAQSEQIDAIIITSIQTDNVKFCLMLAAGGDRMEEWKEDMLEYIEQWAREHGCTEFRIYGRRGWAKLLGYEIEYTKMVKKL